MDSDLDSVIDEIEAQVRRKQMSKLARVFAEVENSADTASIRASTEEKDDFLGGRMA